MTGELNPEQTEAAKFLNGIASVIAVPGSGKTRTMMERIGILVNEHGVSPENILGLTFTRNAADEMRSRLNWVLGDQASRVTLLTAHAFCYHILKKEGRTFEILSGKEQIIFIRDVMKKLKVKDLSIGMVLGEISLAKNNLISVDDFRDLYTGDKTMLRIASIYDHYEQEKSKKLFLDFDDLLVETYHLFKDNKNVRDRYQDTYTHCLVDEFQDTNVVQIEILKLLIGGSGNGCGKSFWVCGDDWQSIYGFTGCTLSNLLNFKEMFPDAHQYILSMNYRSTQKIIQACQNLIQHNVRKIDKTLQTQNADGEDVIVLESSTEESESFNIVHEIRELVETKKYAYKDIAVLYRANFQSRTVEEAFLQHKIPYHIENGLNFYNRREVKLLLDYLRVISDPLSDEGDEALIGILNTPNRYLGRTFRQELEQFSLKRGVHLYEGLKSLDIRLPYIRKNVKELVSFLDPLIEDAANLEPSEVINLVRVSWDYDRFITDEDLPSPDDVKIANINQLQLAAARYNNIRSFLEYTETFEDEAVSDNKEGVNLMTIHKAKGLEFKAVFLIGMVEGILPSKKGDIEEERRICFVAISRSMDLLYLSYSQNYLGQPSKKSIFLDEILGRKNPAQPATDS